MTEHHIFRSRFNRQLLLWLRRRDIVRERHWPEFIEYKTTETAQANGKAVDRSALAATWERSIQITPTSRYWRYQMDKIAKLQPLQTRSSKEGNLVSSTRKRTRYLNDTHCLFVATCARTASSSSGLHSHPLSAQSFQDAHTSHQSRPRGHGVLR